MRKMTNTPNARCHTADATAAGATRFCACSNRNGTSSGCWPSTWTDRCPADSFARTSGVEVESLIGNVSGLLVEVLSRTGLSGRNCKTGASAAGRVYHDERACGTVTVRNPQFVVRNPQLLDPARPGSNGGIPAAVGMQERERIGRTRFAANRDQNSP